MAVTTRDLVCVGVGAVVVPWLLQMTWSYPCRVLGVLAVGHVTMVLAGVGPLLSRALGFLSVLGQALRRRTRSSAQNAPSEIQAPPVQCAICLEMMDSATSAACCATCPTTCCAPCFEKYLHVKITQDRQPNLTCPGCAAALSAPTLERFLSPYLQTKRRELEMAQHAFKCPKCHSPKLTTSRYSMRSLTCTQCKSSWCVDCGQKYHYLATKACHDRSFRQWRAKHPVKACPNCQRFIEKNEGCRHITCTQCKFEFCWKCLYKWNHRHICR